MGILVKMFDSASVEGRRTTNDSMNLVALLDQELSKVRAVLTGDTFLLLLLLYADEKVR